MTGAVSEAKGGEGDYYAGFLSSPEYRESRARKAAVVGAIIGEEIRSAEVIGDLGSGTGLLKRELERICGKRIFGFEVDREVVIARERTCVADGGRLPIPDASFDLLIVNHVYEHVGEPRRLFEEVSRVLRPGGRAYVTAGSRWAIMEPHYRLPFLSWLPQGPADSYVRLTRRGEGYRGIRFLGYGSLRRALCVAGLHTTDITEQALGAVVGSGRESKWRMPWRMLSLLPQPVRRAALRWAPQWFFLLTRND
ncbi:methyltransferase domain-containing protein [Candidatus Palauibacter sp.]|uniref:class I SAM-dependent methyltransferase n=1 Tax=Candidatus Palauibacter sp. TaxID=3101350 RepID=UPI003B0163FE